MARKTGTSLSDGLENVHQRYKRGSLVRKVVKGSPTERESALMQEFACLLSAAGYSESYIADALGTTRGVINGWFKNDPAITERVQQIKEEITTSAVKLMRSYALEIVETLMQMARTTDDEALAAKIYWDLLDRIGMSKVNKSESVSAQNVREEKVVAITDRTGLADALKDAPPEVQVAIAEKLDEAFAMAAEHTDQDVTT